MNGEYIFYHSTFRAPILFSEIGFCMDSRSYIYIYILYIIIYIYIYIYIKQTHCTIKVWLPLANEYTASMLTE